MDPVAQQFITALDEAYTELPQSVASGLVMCGDDALPALLERLDVDRPPHQRRHAADVLARTRPPEAMEPLLVSFALGSPHPAVTKALGGALRAYGAAIREPAMVMIADERLLPQARMAFVSLLVAAGVDSEALDDAVEKLLPDAPRDALLVMRMQPKGRWVEVIRDHREALMAADPGLMTEVLRESLPHAGGVDADEAAKVQKVLAKHKDYAAMVRDRIARRQKNDDDA